MSIFTVLVLITLFILWKMFRIVPQRHAAIKERFGKYVATLEPGFHFLVPFIDRIAYEHEMREQVIDVPPQQCITKDNVQVEVDGIVYLKVMDPYKASYGIGDYIRATVNLAQTTIRSEIGKLTLDHTFSERDNINATIVQVIDEASEPWGIKMIRYEIRNITPSDHMLQTMEKQMEAERQKRAEITLAEGEREAKINVSTGKRQAEINISEGEKQKRINEAEGKAKQIELVSEATAEGLKMVAEAIGKPGGSLAVKMRILEKYLEDFEAILGKSQISVVPESLANIQGFFQGLTAMTEGLAQKDQIQEEQS
ncbi:MAG: paraslipin [Candidatus Hydrogenedentota bacterium]|nr:MAG: paraslipin [Candidatus Hydrogenedentota bacterium]